jgi:3-hydroxyisobutyrate dehydrogenase
MSIKPKIGWIGLGVMGSPMVCNLRKNGYEVFVYTRTKEKADHVLEAGAHWVEDIKNLASRVDILCTMVGYPEDVESVVLGEKGALTGMNPGSLLIDFTTSSPDLAERIAQKASVRTVLSLDAPVSGGDIGAKGGTLAIMCGGEKEAFARAETVLQCLGDKIKYFGGPGAGQRVKMSNQILIASTMVGMVESMLYAERAGLNVSEVIELIGKGAAGCWSINNLGPRIVKEDWAPGFYIKHFLKDMRIALDDSSRMGLNLEGLALAQRFYSLAHSHDWENDGTQALMKILRQINAS